MKLLVGLSSIILLIGLSCQKPSRPTNIMSREEFSRYLVDIYLAESKLIATGFVKDSASKYFLPFEEKLLQKNGISDSLLKNTYQYYFNHPAELEDVYDSVIDTLNLRLQKVAQSSVPK